MLFAALPAALLLLRGPWITYPQLWLVGINVVLKVQLCHKVLGHMPGSVDAHCQGVHYLSMYPMEAGWEVSALLPNNKSGDNKKGVQSGNKTHNFLQTFKIKIEQVGTL